MTNSKIIRNQPISAVVFQMRFGSPIKHHVAKPKVAPTVDFMMHSQAIDSGRAFG